MSGSEHARPVFLTPAQRRMVEQHISHLNRQGFYRAATQWAEIASAWDAAPADPVAVVKSKLPLGEYEATQSIWAHEILEALGCAKDPA